MMHDPNEKDDKGLLGQSNVPSGHEEPYIYKQAGIRERHGHIPIWLALVALGLIGWGVYYTVRYWSVD